MPSPDLVDFRRSFNAPVMQGGSDVAMGPLLTVREVPERLRVSPATVYKLCEAGKLPHVRLAAHAIRIAADDLAAYVRQRVGGASTRRGAPIQ
jgi:excisionase family DNA binding protein